MPRTPSKSKQAPRPYKKRRKETWNLYIFKVLKQVHPQIGMSKKAMAVMNHFVTDCFEQVATEAGRLVSYNNKRTLDARAVGAAVKLVFPGELAKHAEKEAQKAVQKYKS